MSGFYSVRGTGSAVSALVLCVALMLPAFADELPKPLRDAIKRSTIPSASISIAVQAVDDPKPLVEFNAGKLRNPASAIKIVTTWGALEVLGPTHTWTTEVHTLGERSKDGKTLTGDLAIKGGGDPYLVIEDFWRLLGQLRRTGLTTIRGDLIVDDTL